MRITDPSWFYSSMSQASAGIIGLMGGLLLNRLLQQLSVVRESKAQLVADFVTVRITALNGRGFVQNYATHLAREIPAMKKALAEGQRTWQVSQWFTFRGSGGGSAGPVLVLQDEITKYERDRVVCDEFLTAIDSLKQVTTLDGVEKLASGFLQRSSAWPAEAKQWMDEIAPLLVALGPRCRAHAASVLPRNAVAMLVILGWLAVTSVVLPLYFLVTEKGWGAQLFLLVAFSIGIVGLLIYLSLTVNDLRVAGQLQLPERDRMVAPTT